METKKLKTASELIIHSKNSAALKGKATKAMNAANTTAITNEKTMQEANELLSGINLYRKAIKQEKDGMIKPAMEGIKNIRNFWRPIETNTEDAYRIVEGKIITYVDKIQKIADEKKAKLAKRVEGGTMKAETAVNKMEKLNEAPQKIETKTGQVYFQAYKEVVIEDESKLPREYLVPDITRINRDAKAGIKIAGVKVLNKKRAVNRIN